MRLLSKAPGKVRVILPKFAAGNQVNFEHWTEMLSGMVGGPPWFEDRAGLAAGYWYVVRVVEKDSYSYIHESRLTDAGLVNKASR